jgi:hypothetical protein
MDFAPILQAVMALDHSPNIDTTRSLLFAPAYGAVISASILLLGFVLDLKSVNNLLAGIGILGERADKVPPPGIGNGAILWFRVARLLGCLGLLVLSIFPVFGGSGAAFHGVLAQELIASTPYVSVQVLSSSRDIFTAAQLYASGLAFFSVNPKYTRQRLIRHVNCILFLAFCVYVYRDIVPLATFTGFPTDRSEGPRLWGKIALLFVTAVIIPLFTPRQYIPVDPFVSFRDSLPRRILTFTEESDEGPESRADSLDILLRLLFFLGSHHFPCVPSVQSGGRPALSTV